MHYLDTMFRMVDGKVDESGNDFMNSLIGNQDRRQVDFPGRLRGLNADMFVDLRRKSW